MFNYQNACAFNCHVHDKNIPKSLSNFPNDFYRHPQRNIYRKQVSSSSICGLFCLQILNYFIFPLQVSIIFVHKVGQKLKSLQRPGISQPGRACRKWGTAHANASAKANRAAPCKTPGRAQIKRSNSTTKASPTIRAGRAHAA